MKAETLQITWHSKEGSKNEPLLSVDVHPTLPILATAGADWEVKLWKIHEVSTDTETKVSIEYICTLTGHQKTVNVLRFSPNGECLATAGDDSVCIVWTPLPEYQWDSIRSERNFQRRALKRHTEDIYDLSWAPDSRHLVTASIDNTAIVWDASKGRDIGKLDGHSQYVQGVSWDPAGQYIATQSNDRSVRIYRIFQKKQGSRRREMAPVGRQVKGTLSFQCIQVFRSRLVFPDESSGRELTTSPSDQEPAQPTVDTTPESHAKNVTLESRINAVEGIRRHLFLDGNVPSFFRRLSWTPDGTFLVAPCGAFQKHTTDTVRPTTYLFERSTIGTTPTTYTAHWPGAFTSKPSIVVRPSPVLYSLRSFHSSDPGANSIPNNSVFELPYRMLVAVATLDSLYVYDTQIEYPIAALSNFHCDKITDICWSNSGLSLFICSIDGYCSVVSFQSAELGDPLDFDQYPETMKLPHLTTYSIKTKKPKEVLPQGIEESNLGEAGNDKRATAAASRSDLISTPEPAAEDKEEKGAKKRKIAVMHVAPLGAVIQDKVTVNCDAKALQNAVLANQSHATSSTVPNSTETVPALVTPSVPVSTSPIESKPPAIGSVTGGALDSLLKRFS